VDKGVAHLCSNHFESKPFRQQFGLRDIDPSALPTIFVFSKPAKKRKLLAYRSPAKHNNGQKPAAKGSDTAKSGTAKSCEDRRKPAVKGSGAAKLARKNHLHDHTYHFESPSKLRAKVDHLL
jgi:hypothetical protein